MDCVQAREIICEAFDRGVAEVPQAAAAREHCRACLECRRFAEGLALLRKTPSPTAPPELIEAVLERTRMMAEAEVPRASAKIEQQDAVDVETAEAPPARARARWWPRAGMAAAALASVAFALLLSLEGFRVLRAPTSAPRVAGSPATELASPGYAPPAEKSADSLTAATASSSPASTPRFIAVVEEAYAWLGVRSPDSASLTPLDAKVTSSLGSAEPPAPRDAWRSSTDPGIVFLRSGEASGTYEAFKRVVRTFKGKPYAMWAGDVTAFGLWPALPPQYAQPSSADGSPAFVAAGKDDSGLDIFAPSGASPEAGFAIGPSGNAGDPAAGDPNWTWWLPAR